MRSQSRLLEGILFRKKSLEIGGFCVVKPREKTGQFPPNSLFTDLGRRNGWYHWITLKAIDKPPVARHDDLLHRQLILGETVQTEESEKISYY